MNKAKNISTKPAETRGFKKVIGWLHLWLGLISGSIMFVVCITGCMWVFQEEITNLTRPWNNVAAQQQPILLPSFSDQCNYSERTAGKRDSWF